MEKKYLIVNTGSASKKYALYSGTEEIYNAHFEMENDDYVVTEIFGGVNEKKSISAEIYDKAINSVLVSLALKKIIQTKDEIEAIGIRVVAPGEYFLENRIIDKEYLSKAKEDLEKAPLHLGPVLEEIKAIQKIFGSKKIVGVSDSAFHKKMPAKARFYAIPITDSQRLGLQKFGYHGISLQSVIAQTKKRLGKLPSRIVICHLGGGASITAVKDGQSVETSMGFTPLDGLVMATRVGEIDPGAVIYLSEKLKLNNHKLEDYFNNNCGLLGLSGKSGDVRDLIKFEKEGDADSALALEIYADRLKKYIGGSAAVLGGIDLLIFAGTVGERSSIMRGRICEGLPFLGIDLDTQKNDQTIGQEGEISKPGSGANILVMKTDEMEQIVKEVISVLKS